MTLIVGSMITEMGRLAALHVGDASSATWKPAGAGIVHVVLSALRMPSMDLEQHPHAEAPTTCKILASFLQHPPSLGRVFLCQVWKLA